MRFTFRFRLIPFVATLLVVALGLALAQWQTRRAQEKESIEIKLKARESAPPLALTASMPAIEDLEFHQVQVRGEFVKDWPVYLDNRPHQGAAGFHLLMPFKIEGSNVHVLVARGWLARNGIDRARLPALVTPAGTITILGIARRNAGHVMQLGSAPPLEPNAIVQNADPADFAAASKLNLHDFVIEQTSMLPDGLVRDWVRPSSGAEKHRGYAFQWYGLSLMAGLFFVVTGFRRGPKQATT